MDVVENGSGLGKKYNSIVWQHFKDFFSIQNYFTVAMTYDYVQY
jgi:hypothetical protein